MSERVAWNEIEDEREKLKISQAARKLLKRFDDYGVAMCDVDSEAEAALALGMSQERFGEIRRHPHSTPILLKEMEFIRSAQEIEKTPLQQKRKELAVVYKEILQQVGGRYNAHDRKIVMAATAGVKAVCDQLDSLPEAKIHMLYWRLKKYGHQCLGAAHLLAYQHEEALLHDPVTSLANELFFSALKAAESVSRRAHRRDVMSPDTKTRDAEVNEAESSANTSSRNNGSIETVVDPRTALLAGFVAKRPGHPNPYGLPPKDERVEFRFKNGVLLRGLHPYGFGADFVWIHTSTLREIIKPSKGTVTHIDSFRIDMDGRRQTRKVRFYSSKVEKGSATLWSLVEAHQMALFYSPWGGSRKRENQLAVPVFFLLPEDAAVGDGKESVELDAAAAPEEPNSREGEEVAQEDLDADADSYREEGWKVRQPADQRDPNDRFRLYFIERANGRESDTECVLDYYPCYGFIEAAEQLLRLLHVKTGFLPV